MFVKRKKVRIAYDKRRATYFAIIPPELEQFEVRTIEDVRRVIHTVERLYESRNGGNPCADNN
jgi:hypothetical protein